MRISLLIALLGLLFILSSSLFAGTTGKIVGIVKDKQTGEPLIGVNIILKGTPLGGATDEDGSFLILNIPPGTYTLLAQYIGYRSVEISNVKVSVDFTTRVNIEMEEATLELGEAVEVVAERNMIRKDLTASQTEVSAEEISRIPSEEFRDILQLKAGITRDESGAFHIRGGRSSEVGYWVDGLSVTDVFDGSVAVEVENNAIQSLQVISGTFNAEYGQAMSGIINIVTKEGGETYSGKFSSYVGDYLSADDDIFFNIDNISPSAIYNLQGSLDGPIPGTHKRGRFFVNFRRFYNDGWLYGQRQFIANGDTTVVNGRVIGTPGDSTIVPMNFLSWYTGQSKISYRVTDLLKITGTLNFETRSFREYDHFFKFNPDGDFQKFRWSYNAALTIDHTLSKRTFYTLKLARIENNFRQYVYQNPLDPRYVDNSKFVVPAFNFSIGGQKNQHFKRTTLTHIVKFDITSQINRLHLAKAGLEARFHKLHVRDFNIIDGAPNDPELFVPAIPDPTNPNYNEYTFRPFEFSAYLQDKIEFEDFIMNIGLRFDYFDSRGRILADPRDPSIFSPLLPEHQRMSLAERQKIWYKSPSPKYQLSPRVGVAYPITARGVIHFSYGHFLQIPEFSRLYENANFRIGGGKDNFFGNSDLDAQRTVMYEIGLQQQFLDDVGADVTLFYRDIRNWVGSSELKPTYRPDIFYSQFENRDYANVRGITVSINKRFSNHFAANVDYTFQKAEGNASDPRDRFNDIRAGREPRKILIPLDWDRAHVLSGNVYIGFGSFGAGITGRYETGLPYTPNPVQGTRVGANIQKGLRENSGRRPDMVTFDLQAHKEFRISMGNQTIKYRIFTRVFNLFDRRNEQIVYDDTGRATYTLRARVSGETVDPRFITQPQFYTEPRRVQLGVSLSF